MGRRMAYDHHDNDVAAPFDVTEKEDSFDVERMESGAGVGLIRPIHSAAIISGPRHSPSPTTQLFDVVPNAPGLG